MAKDDYESLSPTKVAQLEKAIEEMKKKKLSPEDKSASEKLLSSMEQLDSTISSMVEMFELAAKSMDAEGKETDIIQKAIKPVMAKIDILIEQNQKIAKGIVAVADMVTEEIPKLRDELRRSAAPRFVPQPFPVRPKHMEIPRPAPRPMPKPTMAQGSGMAELNLPKPASPMEPRMERPMERPPMPPGLEAFEKPMPETKKTSLDFGGLFKK